MNTKTIVFTVGLLLILFLILLGTGVLEKAILRLRCWWEAEDKKDKQDPMRSCLPGFLSFVALLVLFGVMLTPPKKDPTPTNWGAWIIGTEVVLLIPVLYLLNCRAVKRAEHSKDYTGEARRYETKGLWVIWVIPFTVLLLVCWNAVEKLHKAEQKLDFIENK